MKKPPIFIIGFPRSGTTLSATLIMKEFNIAVPFESHFIPLFYRWRNFYGNLKEANNRKRLLRAIFIFTALYNWASKTHHTRQLTDVSLLTLEPDIDTLVGRFHDFNGLIRTLFSAFSEKMGCDGWGDYSTYLIHEPLDTLSMIVPDAVFIHVVRDGRDVYCSWRDTWFRPRNVAVAARAWAYQIAYFRRWGKQHPNRYLEIRYEDLIIAPDEQIRHVSELVGMDAVPGHGKYLKKLIPVVSKSSDHKNVDKPILTNNAAKWRSKLTPKEVDAFELEANAELADFNYPLVSKPKTSRISALDRYRKPPNPAPRMLAVKLRCKNLLPAVLSVFVRFPVLPAAAIRIFHRIG